jgi:hypothetical protein
MRMLHSTKVNYRKIFPVKLSVYYEKKILLDIFFKVNFTDPCGVWQVVPMPSSGCRLRKLASCSSRQLSSKSKLIHISKVIAGVVTEVRLLLLCCNHNKVQDPWL